MPTVAQPRLHHLAITVTDLDASVRWYEAVFGVHHLMDVPHHSGLGRILADDERQLMFALHRHDANDGNPFVETTTGLDHAGFVVPARDDLAGAPRNERRRAQRRCRQAADPVSYRR